MLIDLHIHTTSYSGCSSIEPRDLIARARDISLGGIALTEHGILWPDHLLRALRRDAGLGLTILAGQEVACYSKQGRFQGEFLVFGAHRSLGSNRSAEELIETVRPLGGIVIAAHPYKPSRTRTGYYGLGDACVGLNPDAVELGHPDHDEESLLRGTRLLKSRDLPATGGSDAHSLSAVGAYVTECFSAVAGEKDLVEIIRGGRVRPLKRNGTAYLPFADTR